MRTEINAFMPESENGSSILLEKSQYRLHSGHKRNRNGEKTMIYNDRDDDECSIFSKHQQRMSENVNTLNI